MTEKKTLIDNINHTGTRIRNFGAIISVIGAIFISVGIVAKYLARK